MHAQYVKEQLSISKNLTGKWKNTYGNLCETQTGIIFEMDIGGADFCRGPFDHIQ